MLLQDYTPYPTPNEDDATASQNDAAATENGCTYHSGPLKNEDIPTDSTPSNEEEAPDATSQTDNGYHRPYSQNQYPYGQQNRQYGQSGQPPMGGAPYTSAGSSYTSHSDSYQTGESQNSGYSPSYDNSYPYGNASHQNNSSGNEKRPKKRGAGMVVLIVLLCVAAAIAIAGIAIGLSRSNDNSTGNHNNAIENETNADGPSIDLAVQPEQVTNETNNGGVLTSQQVYSKILESSVGVLLYSQSTGQLASEGSGVIIGEDNNGQYTYIVTCAHVIRASDVTYKVLLSDDSTYSAEIVGYDSRTDIGVLRIEASGLKQAEFADVSTLEVGQTVYAIGNPGGSEFAGSFTDGMISAIARPVSSSTGYTTKCIQHTAAINPGNSGGALVNEYGQVIGINSMKIVETEYEGMGFAVPSDIVQEIVNDLIVNGYVPDRAKLGITYRPATAYETYSMVIQIRGLPKGALVIEEISSDSDLNNTEAQPGDMIVAVNGQDLDDTELLTSIIEDSSAGDALTLSMVRINTDYSLTEFDVTVRLVADMGSATVEETEPETTASNPFVFTPFE